MLFVEVLSLVLSAVAILNGVVRTVVVAGEATEATVVVTPLRRGA